MKTLTVYPTFLCPFSCNFCLNKDKSSINENLDTTVLDKFLSEHKFDEIYVSGGEPMNLSKIYFDDVIDTIKKHNKRLERMIYIPSTFCICKGGSNERKLCNWKKYYKGG